MKNITLHSTKVFLSEDQSNKSFYLAKFVICDFTRNHNGVALNRDTIENWINTLKDQPLVGKFAMKSDGEYDFTGHNMIVEEKVDEDGKTYKEVSFDTSAFGTFVDVGIETIDDIECIVASCKVWKRFKTACEIILTRIENGTLYTSFEISVVDYSKTIVGGLVTKIINDGAFIGHCLLSVSNAPAFDTSRMLEIASNEEIDAEIIEALSHDILAESLYKNNEVKEELAEGMAKTKLNNVVADGNKENKTVEEVVATSTVSLDNEYQNATENVPETSSLTEWDLRDKIRDACKAKLGTWCYISFHFPAEKTVWVEKDYRETEMDYVLFTYEVTDDVVTVSEPQNVKLSVSISEVNAKIDTLTSELSNKEDALIKASDELVSLKTQVSELSPFKEKFEKAEQERIENEIAEKKESLISEVVKSGLITKEEILASEEYKEYVNSFDSKSLKAIVAERYIKSLGTSDEVIVSSFKPKAAEKASVNLNNTEDEVVDYKSIMKSYLI